MAHYSSSISNDSVSFADTGASPGDITKYFEPQHAESHGRGVCNDADDEMCLVNPKSGDADATHVDELDSPDSLLCHHDSVLSNTCLLCHTRLMLLDQAYTLVWPILMRRRTPTIVLELQEPCESMTLQALPLLLHHIQALVALVRIIQVPGTGLLKFFSSHQYMALQLICGQWVLSWRNCSLSNLFFLVQVKRMRFTKYAA